MYPVREIKDICFDTENQILLDLYLPETDEPCPVFVFFHGGGYGNNRQKDRGTPISQYLASQGILCVNPAYRHYPDAKFPDFIEDGAKAVAWVKEHIKEYGNTGKLFVGGHSAGAHTSMHLCFDAHYLAAYGIDSKKDIDGYLFISGQPTTHMNVLKEDGTDSRTVMIDSRAPLYYVRDSSGPPLLITCTEDDIKNRLEQNELLVGTLRHFEYQSEVDYHLIYGCEHDNCLYPDEKQPKDPAAATVLIQKFIERNK